MKEPQTDAYCIKCHYHCPTTGTCDYIFIEDHPRPSPPGEGCTARITRKDYYMKKPTWDTDAGRQMWLDGKSDSEIADEFHISTGAVTSYRKKHWDPKTARGGRPSSPSKIERREEVSVPEENTKPLPQEVQKIGIFDVMEAATVELKGIRAICTANAIQNLWNWTNKEALLTARANIDYLLKKLGEENEAR